jgi:hypothetical protein
LNVYHVADLALILVVVCLLIHIRYQPYLHDTSDVLEFISLFISFLTFFFGLILFSPEMKDYARVVISVLIVALNLFFVLFSGYLIVRAAIEYFRDRLQAARLEEQEFLAAQKALLLGTKSDAEPVQAQTSAKATVEVSSDQILDIAALKLEVKPEQSEVEMQHLQTQKIHIDLRVANKLSIDVGDEIAMKPTTDSVQVDSLSIENADQSDAVLMNQNFSNKQSMDAVEDVAVTSVDAQVELVEPVSLDPVSNLSVNPLFRVCQAEPAEEVEQSATQAVVDDSNCVAEVIESSIDIGSSEVAIDSIVSVGVLEVVDVDEERALRVVKSDIVVEQPEALPLESVDDPAAVIKSAEVNASQDESTKFEPEVAAVEQDELPLEHVVDNATMAFLMEAPADKKSAAVIATEQVVAVEQVVEHVPAVSVANISAESDSKPSEAANPTTSSDAVPSSESNSAASNQQVASRPPPPKKRTVPPPPSARVDLRRPPPPK